MDDPMDRAQPPAGRARTRLALGLILAVPLLAVAVTFGLPALKARAASTPANPHGKFQEDCSLCHGADGWKPAKISKSFDHSKYGFALTGGHAATKCESCHASLDFSKPEQLCASCHEDPHRGELGIDCGRCHGARSFLDPARMRRAHQLTRFPLTGGHAALECESCHPATAQGQMQYVGSRADCAGCHKADYDATTAPAHGPAGFPLDCANCHSPRTWAGTGFDHARTAFPLTGAHKGQPCASCHGDGVYQGKDPSCVSCHRANYDGTADPPHAASGFPLACQTCHNTARWTDATFDHQATRFPLTGAHVTQPCSACHGDGVYQGKDPSCVSCHRANYDATTDPPHAASGFPVDCKSCHGTITWAGATFDHDGPYFPIYSGTHLGRWNACADCHTNPSNYAVFNCLTCHPHDDKATTDGHHSGVINYHYDSPSCYGCHPRGTH